MQEPRGCDALGFSDTLSQDGTTDFRKTCSAASNAEERTNAPPAHLWDGGIGTHARAVPRPAVGASHVGAHVHRTAFRGEKMLTRCRVHVNHRIERADKRHSHICPRAGARRTQNTRRSSTPCRACWGTPCDCLHIEGWSYVDRRQR